ncbi:MAG: signal peptidase I [Cytophagales bacterium]|nr:signal peptidase I [Cytophagales bacterium]
MESEYYSVIFFIVQLVIILPLTIFSIMGRWKLYEKAGKPGWAIFIPIYNFIVLLEIIRKPTWWFFMFFIPIANIIYAFKINIELAKAFGKSETYGILMVFFGGIMMPILGFSKDTYYLGNELDEKIESFGE